MNRRAVESVADAVDRRIAEVLPLLPPLSDEDCRQAAEAFARIPTPKREGRSPAA